MLRFVRHSVSKGCVKSGCYRRIQRPLPYHLCNDHVDDRRLAASVSFEAALQRILEFFPDPSPSRDLHEVGRVDVGAVVEIDFRRDPVRLHLQ